MAVDKFAVSSLVLALLSAFLIVPLFFNSYFLPVYVAVAALILGLLSVKKSKDSGKRLAISGIVISGLVIIYRLGLLWFLFHSN